MKFFNKLFNKQTVFCYCPDCKNDLISSSNCIEENGLFVYECINCKRISKWLFETPVPILIDIDKKQIQELKNKYESEKIQSNEFTLKGRYRYFKGDKSSLQRTIDFGTVHFSERYMSYYQDGFNMTIHPKNMLNFSNRGNYWQEITLQEYNETLKMWLKDLEKDLLNG